MQGYKDEPKEKIMATDQFGNPLSEEEERRLILEQQRMGLRPHPVRVKGASSPFSSVIQTPAPYTPSPTMELPNRGLLPYSPTAGDVPALALEEDDISVPSLGQASTALGTLSAVELAKRAAERSGMINPKHGSIVSKAAFEAANPGMKGTSAWRAALTPGTLPAMSMIGTRLALTPNTAYAPTTGATQEEMLALQQSLMDRTSEPTETPVGFATETGAGGFTGGAQMFDMGMDPTFADTGGWGVTQDVTPQVSPIGNEGFGVGDRTALQAGLIFADEISPQGLVHVGDKPPGALFSDTHAGTGTQSRVGRPMVNAPPGTVFASPLGQYAKSGELGPYNTALVRSGPRPSLDFRGFGTTGTGNPIKAAMGTDATFLNADEANKARRTWASGKYPAAEKDASKLAKGITPTSAIMRGILRATNPVTAALSLGLHSPNASDPFLDTPGYAEEYAADQQAQFEEARLSELQALDALNEAHAQSVLASDVTQQPAYTGGDPTIPGLGSALANPGITAADTVSEYEAEKAAAQALIEEQAAAEQAAIAEQRRQESWGVAAPVNRSTGTPAVVSAPAAVPSVAQITTPRTTAKAKAVQKRQQKKAAPKKTTKSDRKPHVPNYVWVGGKEGGLVDLNNPGMGDVAGPDRWGGAEGGTAGERSGGMGGGRGGFAGPDRW